MRRTLACSILALFLALGLSRASGEYPKPSPYRIAWELKFDHDTPRRVVVDIPGKPAPIAYWYMTYSVTNNTDQERVYLPFFELYLSDGRVIRSDRNIPKKVFDLIKEREKKEFMEPWTKLGGELLIGEDQQKDGVAIWEEPTLRLGKFSIFCGGLSGEAVTLKDDSGTPRKDKDGNPIILRKTLQLNYHIRGDDVYPGEDDVNNVPMTWVMR